MANSGVLIDGRNTTKIWAVYVSSIEGQNTPKTWPIGTFSFGDE
jgi:hypothetical protein